MVTSSSVACLRSYILTESTIVFGHTDHKQLNLHAVKKRTGSRHGPERTDQSDESWLCVGWLNQVPLSRNNVRIIALALASRPLSTGLTYGRKKHRIVKLKHSKS